MDSAPFARQHYVVDADAAPWKRGESEGVTYQCQVLLSGEDGGPEALRFRFDDCPSVYAHMHLTAQFQLLLSGTMDFPRGVKHLAAPALHYTDHNMPYGPFAVSGAHEMLVLHPKAGGIVSMANRDARRRINFRGRLHAVTAAEAAWQAIPGAEHTRFKRLMPVDFGPDAVFVAAPAHAVLTMPAAPHGRYEVVLEGSVIIDGQEIGPPGFRYVRDAQACAPLLTGAGGAQVAYLSFDEDAAAGGIEADALGVEAAEAMARAI